MLIQKKLKLKLKGIYSNLIEKKSQVNKIEGENQTNNLLNAIMITNHSCCNNNSSRYRNTIDQQI